MKRISSALALGTGILAVAVLSTTLALADQQALSSSIEIQADHSILSIQPDPERALAPEAAKQWLLPLPANSSRAEAVILDGAGDAIVRILPGTLRGLRVATVQLNAPPEQGMRLELSHDGDWSSGQRLRRYSRGFDAALGGVPSALEREGGASENGSYVILTIPDYVEALAPLVDWKRRKGLSVELVTTDQTGGSGEAIVTWLRQAYAAWPRPPEYLLIVGDVDDIPAWFFSGNVTDHPYTLMDADDWLPDLMLGRFAVSGSYQVETLVNKTVSYEREPEFGSNPDWFRRYLLVAGNYGSQTPTTTTSFCGEQLQSLGFENSFDPQPPYDYFDYLDGVYFPPIYNEIISVPMITDAVNEGLSMIVYRGWALGINGWEAPRFTKTHIPSLNSGAMLPIVMSFVCLNGSFASDQDCFGETWIRQGTPDQPAGAVAFIGNGEHWSHTRYNDAMAISFFERIVDENIHTLGQLSMAGRMRFMAYFPHEMNFADNGEESVEFYMHIYNLLGDPDLNFWRETPTILDVSHAASLAAGSNFVELTVLDADSGIPVEGAQVGVVQDDELLGCAWTGADGVAHVNLGAPVSGADLELTVTGSGRVPYEGNISLDASGSFVSALSHAVTEFVGEGNGDNLPGPGERLQIRPSARNTGMSPASGIVGAIQDLAPYVHVQQGSVSFPDLPAGASAEATQAFELEIHSETADGALIALPLSITHDGGQIDVSDLFLEIHGPALSPVTLAIDGDGWADPGETVSLTVTLENSGRASTGGTVSARLMPNDYTQVVMTDSTSQFSSLGSGAITDHAGDPFVFTLDEGLAPGTQVGFRLLLSVQGGAFQESAVAVLAGRVSPALPVGPDSYGYYAYDSADLFWAQRPTYDWREISPRFGGTGNKIEYLFDNYRADPIALPFDFPYYGQLSDSIRVSDNGWIAFDTDDELDFYNWGIPNAHGNHSLIAPFWDNLNPTVDGSIPGDEFKDGVYTQYDSEAGIFIVEWSRLRHYRSEISDLQTFQLLLLDPAVHPTSSGDGQIIFQYRQVNNSDYLRGYATVGIEDHTETDGLQLSYSSTNAQGMAPVMPGLAVRLSTDAPIHDPFRIDAFKAADDETGLRLNWTSSDPRPVLGWRLYRLEGGQRILLGELPAEARSFVDADVDADEEQSYELSALHPYDQTSKLGPFAVLAGGPGSLRMALAQSLPNPMNDRSRIDFVLPKAGSMSMKVYDPNGRLVRSLMDGLQPAGAGSILWDGRDDGGQSVATGVYFYRLEAQGRVLTRKLMLIR